jgi:hypothetical protein
VIFHASKGPPVTFLPVDDWVPPDQRKPVHALDARQLRAELIGDGMRRVFEITPFRFMAAIQRIAQLERKKIEDVFISIDTEVPGGLPRPPGVPLS